MKKKKKKIKKKKKKKQIKVRMMLLMSIRCNTCGNYINKGTKFNSRKEDVVSETYLGIRILRFYSKCTHCSAELTIKTDPRNSDYLMESGATRTFEPWHLQDEVVEGEKRKRETEEMHYRIKYLENETLDSRREMDTLAALHEMQSVNSGLATVSTDAMLQGLQRTSSAKEGKLEEEDEVLTKSVVFHTSKNFVRRVEHEDLTQPYASNDESLNNTLKVSNAVIVSIFASPSAIFKGVNLLRTVLNVLRITSG
ncbi:splicing factor YJU2-like [Eucalyptus grandis]|uniref:splicing factor YJU2-like n=1 Tax=Eucalyptus grandis TaxID=71139 RepID=UPI00192EC488|nr:splicing factor YJU2-like [Eucalyptus grandis]